MAIFKFKPDPDSILLPPLPLPPHAPGLVKVGTQLAGDDMGGVTSGFGEGIGIVLGTLAAALGISYIKRVGEKTKGKSA
jgi:hypothetical protein